MSFQKYMRDRQIIGVYLVYQSYREQNPEVPTAHEKKEEIYLKELLKVYKEVGGNLLELTTLSKTLNKHLMMQRRLFYSAEGLNRFSRDKLPGAFDELLVQVELGIGNELVYPHETGYEKIRSVINVASSLASYIKSSTCKTSGR